MGVAINVARGRLNVYRDNVHQDEWHNEHQWATVCFDFQELVREGVNLFQSIANLDEDWRLSVHRKMFPYDREVDQQIRSLFYDWTESSTTVLQLFERVKEQYTQREFDLSVIDKLGQLVSEMTFAKQSNDELFSQDATFVAAESAIREHRENLTTEW